MRSEIEGENIPSPFGPEPIPFDYNQYRDDTTVKAVTEIFKILGKHSEKLSFDSKATLGTVNDAIDSVAQEMILTIIENKVPEGDMQTLIETFQVVLHRLFETIARMKKEYEKEYLARALNSRNPGDGHYSRDFSTLGELYAGLEKIRTEQKDDPNGYFYVDKKSE